RANFPAPPAEFSLLLQRLFRPLGLRDVNGSTDVADERAIGRKARHSMIQDPTIFTVISSQTVLHRKLLSRVKGVNVDFQTAVEVSWVDALCPPVAKFLLQRTTGEVEPTFFEKGTELVPPRHPDHHGRRIGHRVKASLALPQCFVGTLALRDVNGHATQPKRAAVAISLDAP